jgi:hypothetical protein
VIVRMYETHPRTMAEPLAIVADVEVDLES